MKALLDRHEHYVLERDGRFLVAALQSPHQVLSTSVCGGGMTDRVRFIVNHQSCEGQGHGDRFEWMNELGEPGYHLHVCNELGLDPEEVSMMGTAANMNYAALVVETVTHLFDERGEKDTIWGSMVKQALKRRKPGFNERYHGFRSFGKLLEEAQSLRLLDLEADEKSGDYIVKGVTQED